MTNTLLDAIANYSELNDRTLDEMYDSTNKVNRMGDQLEYFIKDLISDSIHKSAKDEKETEHAKHLSWEGSKNNPPDIIIRGGEAIEVKKTRGNHPTLQLNSSTPHQSLSSTSDRIVNACRQCEDEIGGWTEKDLVYTIGSVDSGSVNFLWMIYGDCWNAADDVYQDLSDILTDKIAEGAGEFDHVDLETDTNEIGKVRKADPLGRSKLRIRGMWQMGHPGDHFSQHIDDYDRLIDEEQPLFVVMREARFNEFPQEDRETLKQNSDITITEVEAPDPSNPDMSINCVIVESL